MRNRKFRFFERFVVPSVQEPQIHFSHVKKLEINAATSVVAIVTRQRPLPM